jgi:hypothetical protein
VAKPGVMRVVRGSGGGAAATPDSGLAPAVAAAVGGCWWGRHRRGNLGCRSFGGGDRRWVAVRWCGEAAVALPRPRAVGGAGGGGVVGEWRRSHRWSGPVGGAGKKTGRVVGVVARKKTSGAIGVALLPYHTTGHVCAHCLMKMIKCF